MEECAFPCLIAAGCFSRTCCGECVWLAKWYFTKLEFSVVVGRFSSRIIVCINVNLSDNLTKMRNCISSSNSSKWARKTLVSLKCISILANQKIVIHFFIHLHQLSRETIFGDTNYWIVILISTKILR